MSALARMQRDLLASIAAEPAGADRGLEVYRRNLRVVRRDALAEAYPVVLRLVGAAFFDEAARRYCLAVPSRSADLRLYGADFAAFLAAYAPARPHGYLPDVARLEWAVHESRHAADGTAFDFAALGGVPPAALGAVRLQLHPAVRRVRSVHPILALWEANQPPNDGTPARERGPDQVIVRREGFEVVPVLAQGAEWSLLRAFDEGETLANAAASLQPGELEPALVRLGLLGVLGGFAAALA